MATFGSSSIFMSIGCDCYFIDAVCRVTACVFIVTPLQETDGAYLAWSNLYRKCDIFMRGCVRVMS